MTHPGDGTSGPGDSRPETDPGTTPAKRAALALIAAVDRLTVLGHRATDADARAVRELTATYLQQRVAS